MAANCEYQLITEIIERKDLRTVAKLRITEEFFSSELKPVFRFLMDHYNHPDTHGDVPGWDVVKGHYPTLNYIKGQSPIATLCNEVRLARMRTQLLTVADELQQYADVDPRAGLNRLRQSISELATDHELADEISLSSKSTLSRLRTEYETVASGQGIVGIPWPWKQLNEDIQGIQESNYIVLYGRPKSMKTWLALYIGTTAYREHNCRVLVFSMEMPPIDLVRRSACCLARINYSKLKSGKLQPIDRDKYYRILEHLEEDEYYFQDSSTGHQPSFVVQGRPHGKDGGGISSIQAKIEEFKPDLVIIDGIYLMADDRTRQKNADWKVISNISRDIKATCNRYKLPIIGVTQQKRSKQPVKATPAGQAPKIQQFQPDLEDLAYADALGQDTDLALNVVRPKMEVGHDQELILNFPGTREGVLDSFIINGIPGIDFSYKREYLIDQTQQLNSNQGKKIRRHIHPNWSGYSNKV